MLTTKGVVAEGRRSGKGEKLSGTREAFNLGERPVVTSQCVTRAGASAGEHEFRRDGRPIGRAVISVISRILDSCVSKGG
jgi:hypothetical protein